MGAWKQYAHNSCQHELGYPIPPGMIFRQTPEDQADVAGLIGPGAIISTSYSDRLHRVISIGEYEVMGHKTYSLGAMYLDFDTDSCFSELVAVDGRILKLFGNNDDEIIIHTGGQLSFF
ncbi:MAG: hypothetical protein KAS66_00140 [Candidatus Omnitrophica bacterium]|nr:hypothetical protein [Candidatus Omnitrophota bacterium]